MLTSTLSFINSVEEATCDVVAVLPGSVLVFIEAITTEKYRENFSQAAIILENGNTEDLDILLRNLTAKGAQVTVLSVEVGDSSAESSNFWYLPVYETYRPPHSLTSAKFTLMLLGNSRKATVGPVSASILLRAFQIQQPHLLEQWLTLMCSKLRLAPLSPVNSNAM